MKKNLFFVLLFFAVSFASCKKDNNNENESQGTVQFGLSVPQQQSKLKSVSSGEVLSSIVISIADPNGKVIIESKKIALINMNGSYISESLSLVTGNYNITKFLVLNNFDSVIYATPLKGSKLAYLVITPLPIVFNISRNYVTKVVPEVLSAKSFKPEDFGYSSFSFDIINTFDFLATVMVYNPSVKNWELTTANLIIRTADSTIAFSGTLEAITNQITLRDNSMCYILSVSKVGYLTYTATFTANELKQYLRSEDKGPLIVRLNSESITDIDGNQYKVVRIGTQVWMAENLKTTKFNDNTVIQLISDNISWQNPAPAYCWLNNNDPTTNKTTYGALYNWYAVNTGKLCPTGWHVSSDSEWTSLVTLAGGRDMAAGKLKATIGWLNEGNGTDDYAFAALPGSDRNANGTFSGVGGLGGAWWTSTETSTSRAMGWYMHWSVSSIQKNDNPAKSGFSVRCLKD